MWKTRYLKLTQDQLERGVIFSSALILRGQQEEDVIHEVIPQEDSDYENTIRRLKDVKFFKALAKEGKFNVVEIRRS